jgi:hypothetical protein
MRAPELQGDDHLVRVWTALRDHEDLAAENGEKSRQSLRETKTLRRKSERIS